MPLILMVVAQFAGAYLGVLLGFFAIIDSEYQDKQVADGESKHANVPKKWVSFNAFLPLDASMSDDKGLTCTSDGFH